MRSAILFSCQITFASLQLCAQRIYTTILENGGRIDFCEHNNKIAYDRPDSNGYYNVYVTDTMGLALTYITNKPNAPQKHNGTPAWHPGGEWIVFTSQIDSVPDIFDPVGGPGIGTFNNLWITDSSGSEFWQLTDYPYVFPAQGVLHPHFSHYGSKLYWAHMVDNSLGLQGHCGHAQGQHQPLDGALSLASAFLFHFNFCFKASQSAVRT
jgi:Tol biopolymer transport system component